MPKRPNRDPRAPQLAIDLERPEVTRGVFAGAAAAGVQRQRWQLEPRCWSSPRPRHVACRTSHARSQSRSAEPAGPSTVSRPPVDAFGTPTPTTAAPRSSSSPRPVGSCWKPRERFSTRSLLTILAPRGHRTRSVSSPRRSPPRGTRPPRSATADPRPGGRRTTGRARVTPSPRSHVDTSRFTNRQPRHDGAVPAVHFYSEP